MRLSAVVLSHNSEDSIRRCIASLNFCDEIVVIDDNSTDKTLDIAVSLGAKIYKKFLDGDFAKQRNFGLEKAEGEWVLFVDSDEVVSESLASEILGKTKTPGEIQGYYLFRDDHIYGRKLQFGETASVRLLRLGKKNAGIWERPVHEVWGIGGKTGILENHLTHYPHPDVARFFDSVNRYSTENSRYLFGRGVRTSAFQIIFYPVGKFIVNYFWKMGFRDGVPGLLIAMMMSFHSFLTRAKLYLLWKKAHPEF